MGVGNCVPSCNLLIFVEQPAEAITSTHLRGGRPQQSNHGAIGWSLIQRSVRSVPLDGIDVFGQHRFEVAPVVHTLAAHAANPAFRDRIRTRRLDRAAQHVDAGRGETPRRTRS